MSSKGEVTIRITSHDQHIVRSRLVDISDVL